MTGGWREKVPCGKCGWLISTEQPIKAWIRNHKDLDSGQQCLCIGDSDLWVLRFGTRKKQQRGVNRGVQYVMLVEIKTLGSDLDDSQRDLLHIVNQLLRTGRWKEDRDSGRFTSGHRQNVRFVFASIARQRVPIFCFGVHKLKLSGAIPEKSDLITWDDKPISVTQLVQLLRYDLNPDTLRPLEHRSHKRVVDMPALFEISDIIAPSEADSESA